MKRYIRIIDSLQPVMTLEQVAEELSKETGTVISRQAVSQTEKRAFKKIRLQLKRLGIDPHDLFVD